MKRVLSLVLALVMVLGTIVPSFAETTQTAGEELQGYGVIAGSDQGLQEDQALTRAEMAVIYIKLKGEADQAEAYELPTNFSDVAEGSWYYKWVAYAAAQGYMSGDAGADTFRPEDNLSAQEVNALMLKLLNYTVEWANVNAKAEEVGVEVTVAGNEVVRGEIFTSVVAALDVTPVDAEETLGSSLALTGYEPPAPPVPETTEVVSVKALNRKQVEVVFNKELEKAGSTSNYKLEDDTNNDYISKTVNSVTTKADFALQADKKTVIITTVDTMPQQGEIDITVEKIVDEKYEGTFEVLDVTIPEIVGAEAVGIDTVKVTFTEPMNPTSSEVKGNYSVKDADGDTLTVRSVTATDNDTAVLVELYSDFDGDITVKPSGVADYNGFSALSETIDVDVVIDKDAPVVVDYKDVSLTGVTLIMNEEIESDEDLDDFYHTNSSNKASAVTVSGKEVKISFSTYEMSPGTAYVYIAKDAVNDLWDNNNAKIVTTIEVVVDEVKPVVEGDVEIVDQDSIKVTFSEEMDTTADNTISLLDEDGEEADADVQNVTWDTDNEELTINFDEALYGDFTVVLEDFEDVAGNKLADTTLAFNVEDETAPVATDFVATVFNAGANSNQFIVIDFKEEMDAASVTDKANYYYGTNSFEDDDIEITLLSGGKKVEIEVPNNNSQTFNLTANTNLTIGRVKDAGNNKLSTISANLNLAPASTYVAASKVELVAPDTVVITGADEFTTIREDQFSFPNNAGVTIAKFKHSVNSKGKSEITITLGDKINTDVTSGSAVTLSIANTTDSNGNTVYAATNRYGQAIPVGGTLTIADKCAPEVVKDGIDFVSATSITITFTENLNPAYFSASGFNGFSVSGGDAELTSVSVSGKVVTLTGTDFEQSTNVFFNDAYVIKDAAGNALADFSQTKDLQ